MLLTSSNQIEKGTPKKSDRLLWIASVPTGKTNQIFREVIHDIL
jgi:hypothetical protein